MKKLSLLIAIITFTACQKKDPSDSELAKQTATKNHIVKDTHSFSNPAKAVAKHLDLDIKVDFDTQTISGKASWQIDNIAKGNVKDLAGKAKSKKLQPSEMEGSTFTVSNLGMFGIQSFTSIINQPNSAILSVGAIEEKPVVRNGQIVVGNTMMLTLACDHRTVDGATGAQFLQTLRQYLENPVTMLA